jgi:hypothetical protein
VRVLIRFILKFCGSAAAFLTSLVLDRRDRRAAPACGIRVVRAFASQAYELLKSDKASRSALELAHKRSAFV